MAIIKNDHETNLRVRDNLQSAWFSDTIAFEVINSISAVDKIKDNLWISQLSTQEKDKVAFLEEVYSQWARYFYKYLQNSNPSQFYINKDILQKYKSNICKYVYILANDTKRLDYSEEQTLKDNFPNLQLAEKIIQFMDKFETNILGKRWDFMYMRERKSFNEGNTVTRGENTQVKAEEFLKDIVHEDQNSTTNTGTTSPWVSFTPTAEYIKHWWIVTHTSLPGKDGVNHIITTTYPSWAQVRDHIEHAPEQKWETIYHNDWWRTTKFNW